MFCRIGRSVGLFISLRDIVVIESCLWEIGDIVKVVGRSQSGGQAGSAKYLPLYVAEFQFRYNNQMNADIFEEAIRGC
jgi:hypothetical protein